MTRDHRLLHRLFDVGVIIKGIDGVLELAGGLTILLFRERIANEILRILMHHDLSHNANDMVARTAQRAVEHLSTSGPPFAALYLLAHGALKVLLVAGLLRGKLWAYPTALWFLGAFVLYQAYRVSLNHSIPIAVFTVVDMIIMAFIWREYTFRRATHASA